LDQRIDVSLDVQGANRGVDGSVESLDIGEGLVGQMMRFEIAPDNFDVIEFGRILGQPFDGKPVGTGREGGGCRLVSVSSPFGGSCSLKEQKLTNRS
jgi:hypothetical protein